MDFLAGELYHIYNKGQNGVQLFYSEDNYPFFLNKLKTELLPYTDILAYCLMPNHYQILVRVKECQEVKVDDREQLTEQEIKKHPLSRKIGSLQSSYTQSINKQQQLKGALFQQGAKAKKLNEHAITCFHYIHQNPVRAKLCEQPQDWEYSSFRDYLGLRSEAYINKEMAYGLLKVPKDKIKLHSQTMLVIRDGQLENIF